MQVIYVDTLFLINFIIDYLTLLLTAKICSVGMPRLRIALGALTGSAYSVLAIFEPFQFMVNRLLKLPCRDFDGSHRLWRPKEVFSGSALSFLPFQRPLAALFWPFRSWAELDYPLRAGCSYRSPLKY